jgi:hypothetical protein
VRKPSAAVLVLAALLVAGGCGTGGREDDIRAVAERFSNAVGEGDGAAACSLMTADAREQLEKDEREPCQDAVIKLSVSTPPVSRVSVYVTAASADLAGGGTLFLDRTTKGWRVSAAGCEPRGGELPYDCELEV